MKIVAIRKLYKVIPYLEGHNLDFEKKAGIEPVWEIVTKVDGEGYFQYSLRNDYGVCGSGWTTASYGEWSGDEVSARGPSTHTLCENGSVAVVQGQYDLEISVGGDVLVDVCHYGGDEYYPSGSITVNESMLKPTGRGRNKPLIHVITGASGLGKSTLGVPLGAFETDSVSELPFDAVFRTVFVVGNKKATPKTGDIVALFKKNGLDVDFVHVNLSII